MHNYFNYFTEIEERFQQRRGSLLLLSTLDWALIETWREAGIPLEAVLRGIDAPSTIRGPPEARPHAQGQRARLVRPGRDGGRRRIARSLGGANPPQTPHRKAATPALSTNAWPRISNPRPLRWSLRPRSPGLRRHRRASP